MNRASHPAANRKGAASAGTGSSNSRAERNPQYSSKLLGKMRTRLARGAARGRVPNTATCSGRVKAVTAKVMERDSATGRHSFFPRRPRGASRPSPRAMGARNTSSPRVDITDRAKPRSPPEKGSDRQMHSTENPRELQPSGRRPKQPPK